SAACWSLGHVDRRRPGALFGRSGAVVAGRRSIVAIAGTRLDAAAALVLRAAFGARVHGERRLLDRAHVVEHLAVLAGEARVLELHRAAGRIARARDRAPRILDALADR